MSERIAIMDLGTNTFHLLIADVKADHAFVILYKAEEFVKLGENGLEQIGDNPFRRGVDQIRKYKSIIDQFHPHRIVSFGTAAIRRAANGDQFISAIKSVCPMEVNKISGDEEAEFIYLGVRQAVPLNDQPVLIMDIGGGSTEFIIANEKEISWKKSFPVGASILKQKFHYHEPINDQEIDSLQNFLKEELQSLIMEAKFFYINHLIGASGSFDTFAMIIAYAFYEPDVLFDKTAFNISVEQFDIVVKELLSKNLEQRLAIQGMIPFRAEMMVVAAILAQFVVEELNIRKITQSSFALKEGVLWKIIQNEKI
ncbi:MAG: phosphatase [Chitinophagales bacterium]|nr:phosphatase [Chitinophagales bacterium]